MPTPSPLESHHGVLMNIDGFGILIIGQPAVGKSSLALELLHQGHQLIADDIVDFKLVDNTVIGHCPDVLEGLLHTRELGMLYIPSLFEHSAWVKRLKLDYVIEISSDYSAEIKLGPPISSYSVCGQTIPKLILNPLSTASLSVRVLTGIKVMSVMHKSSSVLEYQQQRIMNE